MFVVVLLFVLMIDVILFKDLGPQMSYKTLYCLEYFGPLLLYVICAMQPAFFYGQTDGLTRHQSYF